MAVKGNILIRTNKIKLKLYNHWSSYMQGLGITLLSQLSYLLCIYGYDNLVDKFNNLKIVMSDDIPSNEEIIKLNKFSEDNCKVDRWDTLLRKCQGDLINILNSEHICVSTDGEVISYRYFIDFENDLFEVTNGLNDLIYKVNLTDLLKHKRKYQYNNLLKKFQNF